MIAAGIGRCAWAVEKFRARAAMSGGSGGGSLRPAGVRAREAALALQPTPDSRKASLASPPPLLI